MAHLEIVFTQGLYVCLDLLPAEIVWPAQQRIDRLYSPSPRLRTHGPPLVLYNDDCSFEPIVKCCGRLKQVVAQARQARVPRK